jgi:hypothetical protein
MLLSQRGSLRRSQVPRPSYGLRKLTNSGSFRLVWVSTNRVELVRATKDASFTTSHGNLSGIRGSFGSTETYRWPRTTAGCFKPPSTPFRIKSASLSSHGPAGPSQGAGGSRRSTGACAAIRGGEHPVWLWRMNRQSSRRSIRAALAWCCRGVSGMRRSPRTTRRSARACPMSCERSQAPITRCPILSMETAPDTTLGMSVRVAGCWSS